MASNPALKVPKVRRTSARDGLPILVDSTIAGGDSARTMLIDSQPVAGTKAFRQGALGITLTRAAAEADTTWDGNPDTALNISARTNATGNAASEGAIRGLQVAARNSGTNINWVLGGNISARNDSGKQAVQLHGIDVRIENYGNVGTEIVGIDVNLSDENSNVDPHDKFGIRIRNTDASGMGAVDAALHISSSATNGFNAFVKFDTDATKNCVTAGGTGTATAAAGAWRQIKVLIGTTAYYFPVTSAVWTNV